MESRLTRERLINNSQEVDVPDYVAESFLTNPKHQAISKHIGLISSRMHLGITKQQAMVLGFAVMEVMKNRGV
jgi:hypothetical protein